jgi:hypothetical protein
LSDPGGCAQHRSNNVVVRLVGSGRSAVLMGPTLPSCCQGTVAGDICVFRTLPNGGKHHCPEDIKVTSVYAFPPVPGVDTTAITSQLQTKPSHPLGF